MRTLQQAFLAITLASLGCSIASAQDLTRVSPVQTRAVAIVGAMVHPVSAPEIPDGVVFFADGKFDRVGTAAEWADFKSRARFAAPGPLEIDAKGKHVWPGMISASTQLGLAEMASIRASRDTDEAGDITPEARATAAVNPDSTLLPVARSNGILLAGVFPTGGVISGQPGVIRLHGWTVEDLAVQPSCGVYLQWPFMRTPQGMEDRDREDQSRDLRKRLATVTDAVDQARAYAKQSPGAPIDLRWEGMRAAMEGKARVFIQANDIDQIASAVAFCAERSLKCVIVGGRDAMMAVELLKSHDVPVIIMGTHKLPKRGDSAYDESYTLPKRLRDAGVKFCITSGHESSRERNLPYHAATAVAYGLSADDAMKSVTLWPAEIMGIADRYGTIEAGKSATMIITSGNPLETTTKVERAFIDGREVDLRNKQTELYEKYREKYRQRGELKDEARP
ncbi:MAG: amidohydrolase family protein [Planctomycetota bacterium]